MYELLNFIQSIIKSKKKRKQACSFNCIVHRSLSSTFEIFQIDLNDLYSKNEYELKYNVLVQIER